MITHYAHDIDEDIEDAPTVRARIAIEDDEDAPTVCVRLDEEDVEDEPTTLIVPSRRVERTIAPMPWARGGPANPFARALSPA